MNMNNPTIGVYITTHNRLELLKRAITSVLDQTYQNFHIVIVNDASSDGTQDYLNTLNDPRISAIHHQESLGSCAARNAGISALDTPLVTGLDDDDQFLPDRLETLLSRFDPEYAFICGGYYWDYGARKKALFDKDKVISLADALDLNECSNQILALRERVLAVGGFDPNLPALQDHDLWVRLIHEYGDAYRVGRPSYVVNDDRSFERISTLTNKLTAIQIFRAKHEKKMTERNRENFRFYEKKVKQEPLSLTEIATSQKYGLKGLKWRYYLSRRFSPLSALRLKLLSGRQEPLIEKLVNSIVYPLVATGGPGASRVALLSACIFFFGADTTSQFSADFFALMLMNTAFAQSFGFYLLKTEYTNSVSAIFRQSLVGLLLSVSLTCLLWWFELISMLGYSLLLLVFLHAYYVIRFKLIALNKFNNLAHAEITITLLCIAGPWLISQFLTATAVSAYQVYSSALLAGLIYVLIAYKKSTNSSQLEIGNKRPSWREVRNIAISTTGGIFAVFVLPTAIRQIAEAEIVSIMALAISCISIAILIPRTYANTILTTLAKPDLDGSEFASIERKYRKFVTLSVLAAYVVTNIYLYIIGFSISDFWWLSLCVCLLIWCAQNGFVVLTFLSLQKKDGYVAKLNLFVLVANVALISVALFVFQTLIALYIVLAFASLMFIVRNALAHQYIKTLREKHEIHQY